jgi:hypothetical protein
MPTTLEHIQANPKWLTSDVVPVLAGPNGTVMIGSNSVSVNTLTTDPAYKGKTILIMAAQELQSNLKNIQDIIALNQQIQKALISKIHISVVNADHALNGGNVPFEDHVKMLLAKNQTLANDLVLNDPVPRVLPLVPANQLRKYLDATQLLTQAGAPIKGKIAKIDKTMSDSYYYMEYPAFKAIESFHQAYLADTQSNKPIDLSFVNDLRCSGATDNIELNMNRIDAIISPLDTTNITALKASQLAGLRKITISNLNGNVRIVRGAFAGYNFQSLNSIEFINISGRVLIEDGAFSGANMPNLGSIIFDDITQGVVLKDNVFSETVMPNLTSITLARIQNELTVGNNVLPPNLTAQVSNLGFQSNTGRISILDATLKSLIKFDFDQINQTSGYKVYNDDFQWIKDKLGTVEELIRSGFKGVFSGGGTSQGCASSSCAGPLAQLPTVPSLSAADKNCVLANQHMQAKGAHRVIGFVFLGISGLLLFYAIRAKFSK